MSENTKIEWADHTFNGWIGCTQISPGCDGCYAKAWDRRFAVSGAAMRWGAGVKRTRTSEANWRQPLRWNAEAARLGIRYRVFCASLADVFDNEGDPAWRRDLFQLICATTNLDWLLLTKRIGNAHEMIGQALIQMAEQDRKPPTEYLPTWPWQNVWIGATIVNQAEADRDIPKLLQVPAAKRFLSMEPLLGPVNLTDISDGHADSTIPLEYWVEGFDTEDSPPAVGHNCLTGERWQRFGEWYEDGQRIDWVIVGGESGPGARPMHPDWARSLRDQCEDAGVPFLFKQWGEWCPRGPESWGYPSVDGVPRFRMTDAGHNGQDLASKGDNDVWMNRAGKKAAGRLLDGRTWDEVPE